MKTKDFIIVLSVWIITTGFDIVIPSASNNTGVSTGVINIPPIKIAVLFKSSPDVITTDERIRSVM